MAKRRVAYEEVEEFFELLCSGLSMEASARTAGVSDTAGRGWWRRSGLVDLKIRFGRDGGLPGSAPMRVPGPVKPCGEVKRLPLSSEDRAVIAAGRRAGWSYQRIGDEIGRHKSVVWREVERNSGPDGSYWAPIAHRAAHEQRRRPKDFKLVQNPGLCRRIEAWMDQGWSPRLIARVLAEESPHVIMGRVSHETIYQALYVQTRGWACQIFCVSDRSI